jgi:hypothetical protein
VVGFVVVANLAGSRRHFLCNIGNYSSLLF